MRPSFYYQGHHLQVAEKVKNYLNSVDTFLSRQTAQSPRAAGDAIERLVADEFENFLGSWCSRYSGEFSRREMGDLKFEDIEGFNSLIDVKTHRKNVQFSMPNLTSVQRLAKLYESDTNIFSLILIRYSVDDLEVEVSDVLFSPIEFIDWSCLTVGALGWGQIQIADANNVVMVKDWSRKQWMLQLCDTMMKFYPKEIEKIGKRQQRFEEVRAYWEIREDLWGS